MNIEKLIIKFVCEGKGSRIANLILEESKSEGLKLCNFKTYYKSAVFKTVLLVKESM